MNDKRAPEPYLCGDPECPRCGGWRTDIDGSYSETRATAAREWDEMADAIAGEMLPDACRARWIAGAVRYGREWQSENRNNVQEALDELFDAINYILAAGATGELPEHHAGRFISQVVDLLDRLYWAREQFGREEAGEDG